MDCSKPDGLPAPLADPPGYAFHAPQPQFWFNDGNVIVRVEDSHFRVHSSPLSLRSPFFAELFMQENGGAERLDGSHIYQLQGRASDFMAVLDAIYHNLLVPEKEPSFFTLACMLRAAHHWNFPALKRWALVSLEARWPPTLKNAHQQDDLIVFAARIIILFRECGQTSLLKRAFYRLLSVDDIGAGLWDHTASHSDLLDSESDEPEYYYHDTPNWTARDLELSREDIALVIRLQRHLMGLWANFAAKPPALDFLDRKKCGRGKEGCVTCISLNDWSHQVSQPYLRRGYFDPLGCLQSMKDSNITWKSHTGVSICDSCRVRCEERWEEERVRIWERLDDVLTRPPY